jgi:hypothetical protein
MAANTFPPEKLRIIAEEVSGLLKEKEKTVAVAETVCPLDFSDFSVQAHLSLRLQED